MKTFRNTLLVLIVLTVATGGTLCAATIASLNLSGASAIAAGQSLTVTETFFASATTETEIDTVIGFDPTVFAVSNFSTSPTFSSWTTETNLSPSAGIYDYGIEGPALALAGGGHSVFLVYLDRSGPAPSPVPQTSSSLTTTAPATPLRF